MPPPVPMMPPLTVDAVQSALARRGRLRGLARVVGLSYQPFPSPGMVGVVTRAVVDYRDGDGPRSLVVKEPSPAFPAALSFAVAEARFYGSELARGLPVPEIYLVDVDEPAGRCRLVMEDLGDGLVTQTEGCEFEPATRALSAVAALHARAWSPHPAAEADWIPGVEESELVAFCRAQLGAYRGPWPVELSATGPWLAARFDQLVARLAASPQTVVHGDFHCQNLVFGADVRMLDFQFLQRANPMSDVARLLGTSVRTGTRRRHESRLLDGYLAALGAHGVRYDRASAEAGLRVGLLWNLVPPLALHIMEWSELGQPWPEDLRILRRCLTAVRDWRATELLE